MALRSERPLLLIVIMISLLLTGLTVWAVARQGRALQARERADLVALAAAAAASCQTALAGDVRRAFELAGRAWEIGGPDELDAWAASQTQWWLVFVRGTDGSWAALPRTPLEQTPPAPRPCQTQPTEGTTAEAARMLSELRQLAGDPDPLTRAGALLALAACEQQLGHPLAAARIFGEAAQLLRCTPRLARLALLGELARIDSLLAAGDHSRAQAALVALLTSLLADQTAAIGPMESARLEQQAMGLGILADEPIGNLLGQLRARADRRRSAINTILPLLERHSSGEKNADAGRIQFIDVTLPGDEPVVVAVRPIAAGPPSALAEPAVELVSRYWSDQEAEQSWQVSLTDSPQREALIELGPQFAHAVIQPSPAAAAALRASARRQLGIVLTTGVGTAGAWGVVTWMMLRLVARQRELARLQSRFVADVSHELKTPLALIRLLAETLVDRRLTDPERVHAYHQTIARESERLSLLLDNILDLGRIQSGRKRYEFGPCDLAAVAREAWALFEPQFKESGFDARLELADDLPVIQADQRAMHQVIVNLLQNAHRYGGEGKFVRLTIDREGYVVTIKVEDHGIGMTRSQLQRLGESFFRADDTRVRRTRGTGLGLAIVHHIVTAHHGKIEVHSRPGQGSTFTVWIPFQPQPS